MNTKFENENKEEKLFKKRTLPENMTIYIYIYQKHYIRFHLKTYHYLKLS